MPPKIPQVLELPDSDESPRSADREDERRGNGYPATGHREGCLPEDLPHLLSCHSAPNKHKRLCPVVDKRVLLQFAVANSPVLGEDNPAALTSFGQPDWVLGAAIEVVYRQLDGCACALQRFGEIGRENRLVEEEGRPLKQLRGARPRIGWRLGLLRPTFGSPLLAS